MIFVTTGVSVFWIPSFVDKLQNFHLLTNSTQQFFGELFENNRVLDEVKEEETSADVPSPKVSGMPDARMFLQGD